MRTVQEEGRGEESPPPIRGCAVGNLVIASENEVKFGISSSVTERRFPE